MAKMGRRRAEDIQRAEQASRLERFQNQARELGNGLPTGIYLEFCEEMEHFFSEECARIAELMDQQELGYQQPYSS